MISFDVCTAVFVVVEIALMGAVIHHLVKAIRLLRASKKAEEIEGSSNDRKV